MRLSARALTTSTLHRGWSALARSGRPLLTAGGQRSRTRGQDVHSSPWGVSARATPTAMHTPTYEKDPVHNWMGMEMALRGMEISDFPLCNKSFNLSYAGHDL